MPGNTNIVRDCDNPFFINSTTKIVTNTSSKTTLMQYDNNSEKFTFIVDKFIDGHDMSQCDKVYINYYVVDSATRRKVNQFAYPVPKTDSDGIESNEPDASIMHECTINDGITDYENKLKFSWLISNTVTSNAGQLFFLISFICLDDNQSINYKWSSSINNSVIIAPGIDNSEETVEMASDVVYQLMDDVTTCITDCTNKIDIASDEIPTIVNEYIESKYPNERLIAAIPATETEVAAVFEQEVVDEPLTNVVVCESVTESEIDALFL